MCATAVCSSSLTPKGMRPLLSLHEIGILLLGTGRLTGPAQKDVSSNSSKRLTGRRIQDMVSCTSEPSRPVLEHRSSTSCLCLVKAACTASYSSETIRLTAYSLALACGLDRLHLLK